MCCICCCAHRRGLSGGCWPSVAVRATAGDWDTKGFLSPALAAHEVLDEFLNLGVASHLAVLAGEQPIRVPLGPARGQRGTAAAPPRHRTWDSPRGTAVPLLPLLRALYPSPSPRHPGQPVPGLALQLESSAPWAAPQCRDPMSRWRLPCPRRVDVAGPHLSLRPTRFLTSCRT